MQPTRSDFIKYFYLQCYSAIIETLCITKPVTYGIVLVKNVKLVFKLKQIYFLFPAQTAVKCSFQHIEKILLALVLWKQIGGKRWHKITNVHIWNGNNNNFVTIPNILRKTWYHIICNLRANLVLKLRKILQYSSHTFKLLLSWIPHAF